MKTQNCFLTSNQSAAGRFQISVFKSNWGALIFRAEIIPFEPARVIPGRERSNIISHVQSVF